tara:strand:+ start:229 stop:828 length:600 start_codon:yes stop_codon:yes gene_type:complete
MSKIMALDIETSNYSWEVGGWDATHLFDPTVVATWDGDNGHVFSKEDIELDGVTTHPLHPRDLGEHLQKHIEDGGMVIGHNLMGFDLPILRDALDCHYAGQLMKDNKEHIIDTSAILRSVAGMSVTLGDVCKHTLGNEKLMDSADAPKAWKEGRYQEVAEYCLKDAQLVYDLLHHGRDEGFVKARNIETGIVDDIEVMW